MPWKNTPGQRIPERLRQLVLTRDEHRCTRVTNGARCTSRATEVDHITPRHKGGTDHPTNLASLCPDCHRAKTQAEAAAARHRYKAKREPEQHPGLA